MRIYLLRHARPDGVEGLCYGRKDVRANAEETTRVARSLRTSLPSDVLEGAPIHSSPLSRCSALARELVPARATVIAPELTEVDFGSWEGRAWDDVPRDEIDAWAEDLWGYAPGGGESARSALVRFKAWADRLQDEGNASVMAVTHAGLIRLALSAGPADAAALTRAIPYGSMHLLVLERRTPT